MRVVAAQAADRVAARAAEQPVGAVVADQHVGAGRRDDVLDRRSAASSSPGPPPMPAAERDGDRLAGGALVVGDGVGARPAAEHVASRRRRAAGRCPSPPSAVSLPSPALSWSSPAPSENARRTSVPTARSLPAPVVAPSKERSTSTAPAGPPVPAPSDTTTPRALRRVADRVAADAAVEVVDAAATVDRVVAGAAGQHVRRAVADDRVAGGAALDLLDPGDAARAVDAHAAAARQREARARAGPTSLLVADAVGAAGSLAPPSTGVAGVVGLQQVVAGAADERSGAGERVVAVAAVERERGRGRRRRRRRRRRAAARRWSPGASTM